MKFTAILCVLCIGLSSFVTHTLHIRDKVESDLVMQKQINIVKKVYECRHQGKPYTYVIINNKRFGTMPTYLFNECSETLRNHTVMNWQ